MPIFLKVVWMGEEKKEVKLVDVSFTASLKFWLAYLIVQIIAMVIVFGVMFAFIMLMAQTLQHLVPQIPTAIAFFL